MLLHSDVFTNFRNLYLEVYGRSPAHFISAPGSAGQAALKKD